MGIHFLSAKGILTKGKIPGMRIVHEKARQANELMVTPEANPWYSVHTMTMVGMKKEKSYTNREMKHPINDPAIANDIASLAQQVWSLTQFPYVGFLQLRISAK